MSKHEQEEIVLQFKQSELQDLIFSLESLKIKPPENGKLNDPQIFFNGGVSNSLELIRATIRKKTMESL